MTSAQDFLMGFMKQLVHVKNTDQRPQIVQEWAKKLEAREAEFLKDWPTCTFNYEGSTYKFPFKLGCNAGVTIRGPITDWHGITLKPLKSQPNEPNLPPLIGGYTEEEIVAAIKSGTLKPIQKAAGIK